MTRPAGITFQERTGARQVVDIVQTSTGGCGMFDFDGDGKLDLFLVQGLHGNGPGEGNRLYRNRGDGTFEDVTERAGVRGHGYGMGCAVGDYDGDGRPDLFVTNNGTSELYHNQGDGTFRDVSAALHADVTGCAIGAVFADLDGDHWPDLYVTRYISLNERSRMLCSSSGVPVSCDPQSYPPQSGVFLHNRGGQGFEDRTKAAGLSDDGRGMSAVAADLNGDGHLDLFVTNDTSANSLFLGDGKGHFHSAAAMAGVGYGELGVAEANMGVDAGDYDGDGRPDLFIGVMQDRSNLLFHNEGGGIFNLVTRAAGLTEPTAPVVTWGAGFLDYDNDGDLDLFEVNGHVNTLVQRTDARLRYQQPRQLFENVGGRFLDRTNAAGAALTTPAAGRGVAFGDVDNDGDVDLLVNNLDGAPMLLTNTAERRRQHWLRVRLRGRFPDLTPEGAVVELQLGDRKLVRHLHAAYSYASANDCRLHFGLGGRTQAGPLRVLWPDGTRQEVQVPGPDREIVVRHP